MRVLTRAELQQGDVSLAYVSRLMHRTFRDTPLFRKVLQCVWHQVNHRQMYVVGQILEDGTVKGGTGWGAEFAKLCNKPLFVFAQDQEHWFHWTGEAWEEDAARGSPTPSSPAQARVFCKRAGCGLSTRCSSARFASVDK